MSDPGEYIRGSRQMVVDLSDSHWASYDFLLGLWGVIVNPVICVDVLCDSLAVHAVPKMFGVTVSDCKRYYEQHCRNYTFASAIGLSTSGTAVQHVTYPSGSAVQNSTQPRLRDSTPIRTLLTVQLTTVSRAQQW